MSKTVAHAPKGTVALGIPSARPEPHFARSLAELVLWDREYGRRNIHPEHPWVWVNNSTMITNARNQIVAKFLEQGDGADWLLFMDDDQIYPHHTIEALIESADPVERRIVGLPVWRFISDGHGGPVRVTHNVLEANESGALIEWTDPFPENSVLQVAAVGTGCMLIHRSALEEMRQRSVEQGNGAMWCWFRQQIYQPADMCEGEDLFFCRLAWNCGIGVWVSTALTLEHVKRVVLHKAQAEGEIRT